MHGHHAVKFHFHKSKLVVAEMAAVAGAVMVVVVKWKCTQNGTMYTHKEFVLYYADTDLCNVMKQTSVNLY